MWGRGSWVLALVWARVLGVGSGSGVCLGSICEGAGSGAGGLGLGSV